MLLLPRVPFIREKQALEKCFAPIDPSYSYPEYEGKNFHIYSVLYELFSPTFVLEQAGSFGSKLPPKNLQNIFGSVIDGLVRIQDRQLKFLYTNECELCLFLRVVFGLWNMFREILYTLTPNYCFRMLDSTSTTGARKRVLA